jgi:hypothetical protein
MEKEKIVYCVEADSNGYNDEDYYYTLEDAEDAALADYKDELETVQIVKRTENDDFNLAKWKYNSENEEFEEA